MSRSKARQDYVLAERSVPSAPGWRLLPYNKRLHQPSLGLPSRPVPCLSNLGFVELTESRL